MFASELQVLEYDALISDLDQQLITNSMTLQLKHRYSSMETEKIHKQFGNEKDQIKNELSGMDRKDAGYQDLMDELSDLEFAEDEAVEKLEKFAEEDEDRIETENTSIQTRRDAANADREGFKKMLEEDVKNQFSYFQQG